MGELTVGLEPCRAFFGCGEIAKYGRIVYGRKNLILKHTYTQTFCEIVCWQKDEWGLILCAHMQSRYLLLFLYMHEEERLFARWVLELNFPH
jgi:hypothetical protein